MLHAAVVLSRKVCASLFGEFVEQSPSLRHTTRKCLHVPRPIRNEPFTTLGDVPLCLRSFSSPSVVSRAIEAWSSSSCKLRFIARIVSVSLKPLVLRLLGTGEGVVHNNSNHEIVQHLSGGHRGSLKYMTEYCRLSSLRSDPCKPPPHTAPRVSQFVDSERDEVPQAAQKALSRV